MRDSVIEKISILVAIILTPIHIFGQEYESLRDTDRIKPVSVYGQEKGGLQFFKLKSILPIDGKKESFIAPVFGYSLGYAFSEYIYLTADLELGIACFDKFTGNDGRIDHGSKGITSLGATLGANVLNSGRDALQANLSAGNTIESGWRFFYADAGFSWLFRPKMRKFHPYLTAGIRYFISEQKRFDDHVGIYLGFGIRKNSY